MNDGKYLIEALDKDQIAWVYSDNEKDLERGTIGHLRFDMGSNGLEFWTSWWPHNDNLLNSEAFKSELDNIINTLRRTNAPLHNLSNLSAFCIKHGDNSKTDYGRSSAFKIETKQYMYMLRLSPHRGEYSYIYCYDKEAQRESQEKSSVISQLIDKKQCTSEITNPAHKKRETER